MAFGFEVVSYVRIIGLHLRLKRKIDSLDQCFVRFVIVKEWQQDLKLALDQTLGQVQGLFRHLRSSEHASCDQALLAIAQTPLLRLDSFAFKNKLYLFYEAFLSQINGSLFS